MLLKSRKSALKWRGGEEEGGERGGERERDKRKNFEGADPKLAHVSRRDGNISYAARALRDRMRHGAGHVCVCDGVCVRVRVCVCVCVIVCV